MYPSELGVGDTVDVRPVVRESGRMWVRHVVDRVVVQVVGGLGGKKKRKKKEETNVKKK